MNKNEMQELARRLFVELGDKDWFDICALNAILRLLKRQHMTASPAYTELQRLHCIDYNKMTEAMKEFVAVKSAELCGF